MSIETVVNWQQHSITKPRLVLPRKALQCKQGIGTAASNRTASFADHPVYRVYLPSSMLCVIEAVRNQNSQPIFPTTFAFVSTGSSALFTFSVFSIFSMALQNSLATMWKTQHPPMKFIDEPEPKEFEPGRPPTKYMDRLPESCLWQIINTIADAEPLSPVEPTSMHTLMQLSLVDKRTRYLCLPFLFTFTQLELDQPRNGLHRHVKALAKASLLVKSNIT